MSDRDGCYMLNFFNSQPALNYGFNEITHPSWQMSYTDPRVQGTFEAILDVMRFWLDHGCDGFRVDMADSLVKNDEEKVATASLWRKARAMLDKDYPEAMMVMEWCNPARSINMAGFHCDFLLNHYKNFPTTDSVLSTKRTKQKLLLQNGSRFRQKHSHKVS